MNKKPYPVFKYANSVNGKNAIVMVDNLHLSFKDSGNPHQLNKVIRGASLRLYENEILAIIGESGSGKSVITSAMYGLAGSGAVVEGGKIFVLSKSVESFTEHQWEKSKLRGVGISAVFQNPMTTLNPTMKVGKQIMEGLIINKLVKSRAEAYKQALSYLRDTRINNPEQVMNMYPHELSGGMRQRVVIASIIALRPRVLVLDEPTTALDPTVQALVLDIIRELKQKHKMSIIFITHDLGVVASIADRIAIMYAGQFVEEGMRDEIMWYPQHPYTWGLLLSMPDLNFGKRLYTIKGSVPGSLNSIKGQAFASRDNYAMGVDFLAESPLFMVSPTHFAKTWLLDEKAPAYEPPVEIAKRWKEYLSTMQGGK